MRVPLAAVLSGVVFTQVYSLAARPMSEAMPDMISFMVSPLRIVLENVLLIVLVLLVCFVCFRDMTRREVIISSLLLCGYYIIVIGLERAMAVNLAHMGITTRLTDIVTTGPWWIVPFSMPMSIFRHLRVLAPDYGELLLGFSALYPLLYAVLAWCRRMPKSRLG